MQTDKTAVVIFTKHFRVKGWIGLLPGTRLTDYMNDAHLFVAVTDATISDHAGNQLAAGTFLNLHRDRIEVIMPAEPVEDTVEED